MRFILLEMTEPDFSSVWVVLEDPRAAEFVVNPASNRYLAPFLGRERSPVEVARELGVDVGSVTYRVRQMLELSLVEKSRLEPRSGRPIQFYRSSATGFFAPLRLTQAANFEELRQQAGRDSQALLEKSLYAAWQALKAEAEWGVHLYRTPEGEINRDFVPLEGAQESSFWDWILTEQATPLWDQYFYLNLPREKAKDLQLELAGVLERYAAHQDESETLYGVRLALAPLGLDAVRSGR